MRLPTALSPLTASLTLLCALAAPALAGETGIDGSPYWTVVAPGADFYQVSTTTRSSTIVNPQVSPFVASMPAPPAGTQVVEVFALWNYNLAGAAPNFDTIGINGQPVAGDLIGQGAPDLNWGKDRTVVYIAKNVGQYLNFGGANTISGACDKAMGSDPHAFGAGMSIVVVYRTQVGTDRRVSLWTGYSSTESSTSGDARVRLDLPSGYLGGSAHFCLNALDGETIRQDVFLVNSISAGGLLDGTVAPFNAWQGLEGPGAADSLYDCMDDDIKDFMTVGDLELRARTQQYGPGIGEELGHSLAVLSTIESCGSWQVYCTAKVNSLGCTPVISAVGTPSAGASGAPFLVSVDNVLNNMNGLMFYGYAQQAVPFQGGTLCVAPPLKRLSLLHSGGSPTGTDCTGQMTFDFNAHVNTGFDPLLTSGTTVFAQYWSRDVGDPFGSSLSAGIVFDLCQ